MKMPPFACPFGLLPIFLLLWIMLLWTFLNKFLCHHVCSFISSWYIIRDRIARSYDNCVLFLKNYQTVSKVSISFPLLFIFSYFIVGIFFPALFPIIIVWVIPIPTFLDCAHLCTSGFFLFCFVYFPLRVPVLLGPTVQLFLWDFLLLWIHTPTSWTPCPCIIEFLT